jgi:hypothetical protein
MAEILVDNHQKSIEFSLLLGAEESLSLYIMMLFVSTLLPILFPFTHSIGNGVSGGKNSGGKVFWWKAFWWKVNEGFSGGNFLVEGTLLEGFFVESFLVERFLVEFSQALTNEQTPPPERTWCSNIIINSFRVYKFT